ncbi:MAG: SoxR reducing system RseC family protein [Clostridia bacterium]|nr:SoxR reducing system RseC family protein [Clostridia bacterium]
MRKLGMVRETNGTKALVAVQRMSACAGCHKADPGSDGGENACHECSIFPVGTELTVTAENAIGAVPGDRVALETATQTVLGYAAAVFLLPLVLALIGGIAGNVLTAASWAPALGAVSGFVLAFVFVRLTVNRYAEKKTVYSVVEIVRRNA